MSIRVMRAILVSAIIAVVSATNAATILLKRPPSISAVFLSGTEYEFGVRAVADQLLGIFHRAPQFAPRIPRSIPTDLPCPAEGTCIVHEAPLLGIPDGDLSLVPGVPVTMATHLLRPWVKEPEVWGLNFIQGAIPPQMLTITVNVAGFDANFLYEIDFESFETSGADSPSTLLHRKMLHLSAQQVSPDPVGFDLGATGQLEVSIQISPQIGVGVSHYPYADSYTDWGYGSIETSFLLHSTPEASTFTLFVTMVSIAAGSIRPASRADRSRRLTQSDPTVRWFDAARGVA